jgi:hypothetical protein
VLLLSRRPADVGASESTAPAGPAHPQESPPVQDLPPLSGCGSGSLEFDRHVSLDNFRQALIDAISRGDHLFEGYLQERLSELVGDDAERALQVLEWARHASQPEPGIFLDALKTTAGVQRPAVVERLLEVGEDERAPLENRGAALDALETQKRFSPATLARVKALALDESLDSASWLATRTIGRVMKLDFESSGDFAPYWNALLDISERSKDTSVRLLALEMPNYSDPLLDEDSMVRLDRLMRDAPERKVREMAAHRLAFTEHWHKALEYYREAFPKEKDLCMRASLMRFALRVAGPEALPLAARFAAQESRLAQDYQDFKRLYADGTRDWPRIMMNKPERHSRHGCSR